MFWLLKIGEKTQIRESGCVVLSCGLISYTLASTRTVSYAIIPYLPFIMLLYSSLYVTQGSSLIVKFDKYNTMKLIETCLFVFLMLASVICYSGRRAFETKRWHPFFLHCYQDNGYY